MSRAPSITPTQISQMMEHVVFRGETPDGTTSTFVHAYLHGSFYLATGHSACVSPENFDPAQGYEIARQRAERAARDKLWELEGYRLYLETLSPGPVTRYRCAESGGYVSKEYADANPSTTIRETR